MKQTALLLVSAVVLCGCATTGYEHASETRSAISDARIVTVAVQERLDTITTSLQNFNSNEVTNLQAPYQAFSKAVDNLSDQLDKLSHCSQAVHEEGNDYLAAWQEQLGSYQNTDLRTNSATRRAEVMDSFRRLNSELQAAQSSVRPVLTTLKDMQRYLATDLTTSGVASIQQQSGQMSTQIADIQLKLQSLVAELDRVSIDLSPMRPAKQEASPAPSTPTAPLPTSPPPANAQPS